MKGVPAVSLCVCVWVWGGGGAVPGASLVTSKRLNAPPDRPAVNHSRAVGVPALTAAL